MVKTYEGVIFYTEKIYEVNLTFSSETHFCHMSNSICQLIGFSRKTTIL